MALAAHPLVVTSLSDVDGAAGVLRLRGFTIEDLIEQEVSYVAAVALLFSEAASGGGDDIGARLLSLPLVLVESGDPFVSLRRAISLVPDDQDDIAVAGACGRLVGCLAGRPEQRGSYVERILRGSAQGVVDDDDVLSLDRCFVVHLDHALNPGTLCCRVAASTGAPLSACITAGLCALQGPLHGGASSAVGLILERELSGPDHVDAWVAARTANKLKVPGFGHPIYRHQDPRTALMRALAIRAGDRRRQRLFVDTALALEHRVLEMSEGKLFANVDFYAACLYATLGIPLALHTPLFFAARVLGWTAHAREQKIFGRVISPEAAYNGPPPRSR